MTIVYVNKNRSLLRTKSQKGRSISGGTRTNCMLLNAVYQMNEQLVRIYSYSLRSDVHVQ